MSSQINPSTINPNYPVPGVNQSSGGFRQNFLAIQNAFSETVSEMNDLINKAIVSAPLTYGTPTNINDFGGMQNSNLAIYDYALTVFNNGNVANSAIQTVSFSNAAVQQYNFTTANSSQTLAITNFPNLGFSEVVLAITANVTPQFINLSALTSGGTIHSSGHSGLAGFNAITGTYTITTANALYLLTLSSLDGTNWIISNKTTEAVVRNSAPTANIGTFGDTKGMIAQGNSNLYVCVNNYDGSNVAWKWVGLNSF